MKKIIRRIYLWVIIKRTDRRKRSLARRRRVDETRYTIRTIIDDLWSGRSLGELRMSDEDFRLLMKQYGSPIKSETDYLHQKYRGFKFGDHPSIYKKIKSQ